MLVLQDFGLAHGVNDAICKAMQTGRAGSVSCLSVSDLWPATSRPLKQLADQTGTRLGIKLALTGAFAPLTAGFTPAFDGSLPNLSHLVAACERLSLQREILAGEFRAQIRRYQAHMDGNPYFVDLDPVILLFGAAIDGVSDALAHFSLQETTVLIPQPTRGEAIYPVPLSGRIEQFRFAQIRRKIWIRGGKTRQGWTTRLLLPVCENRHLPSRQTWREDDLQWSAATPALPDPRLDLFDLHPHWREQHLAWLMEK